MTSGLHIDIAEFALLVLEIPESERGAWVTNLAEALRDNEPSRSEYAARLLARRDV